MVLLRHQGPNMALGSGAGGPIGGLPQSRVVKNPTLHHRGLSGSSFFAEIQDWHAP
jgi:hypothetical protein